MYVLGLSTVLQKYLGAVLYAGVIYVLALSTVVQKYVEAVTYAGIIYANSLAPRSLIWNRTFL